MSGTETAACHRAPCSTTPSRHLIHAAADAAGLRGSSSQSSSTYSHETAAKQTANAVGGRVM